MNINNQSERKLQPGEIVGDHFRIEKFLKYGGEAEIYTILDKRLNTEIALKVTNKDDYNNLDKKEIIINREAQHQNVCPIYDYFIEKEKQLFCIYMRHIEGLQIKEYFKKTKIKRVQVVRIFEDIFQTMMYLHKKHIFHRDLSGSNILISNDDQIYFIDFNGAEIFKEDEDSQIYKKAVQSEIRQIGELFLEILNDFENKTSFSELLTISNNCKELFYSNSEEIINNLNHIKNQYLLKEEE